MPITHGANRRGNRSLEYTAWAGMLYRCRNKNCADYHNYGGRGIKVCKRWEKFENFFEDMGKKPLGTSIDRFPDVNGHYEPKNCRWATKSQQANNTRDNVFLEWRGKKQTITLWAKELSINKYTIMYRIRIGWSAEKALSSPIQNCGRHSSSYGR